MRTHSCWRELLEGSMNDPQIASPAPKEQDPDSVVPDLGRGNNTGVGEEPRALPRAEIPLPSQGLIYPKVHPLHNQSDICSYPHNDCAR